MPAAPPRVVTAVPTAFRDDGVLDLDASRAVLEFSRDSGVDGVFVTGTMGEFPALDRAERAALAGAATDVLDGLETIVHVGAASGYQVRGLLDDARAAGATRVAVVTPYYLPAADRDVLDFFAGVSTSGDGLDLYAYLFRSLTGVTVEPGLLGEIAALPGFRGAKISGETAARTAEYRAAVSEGFVLYTGQDALAGRTREAGVDGVVSGVASCLPELFTAVRDAIAAGEHDAAATAQRDVEEAVALIDGDLARVKTVLQLRGVIPSAACRMAVGQPDAETRARLEELVERHVRH